MSAPQDARGYGADASGLVWGFRFDAAGCAHALESDAAARHLAERRAGDSAVEGEFIWLHFSLAHAGARRWLARCEGLSPAFLAALDEELRSTRIERDEDALVAVLNDVHYDFSFDASEIATMWVALDSGLVVTARQSPLRSVDQLRTAVRGGLRLQSTAEMLERLLRAQADVLVGIVRDATRRIDQVEDQLLAGRLDTKRARLGALRRLLVRLQRLLAPEPASLFRLLQHPPPWMGADDAQNLREASEEFSVAIGDMASLQERIRLLQEEVAAAVNQRTGRNLFVLTVLTVLALPINIMAGLFGMNVGGVPFADSKAGFWIITAIVGVFMAIGAWLAFRDRGD